MPKVMLVEDDNNLREIYAARMQAEGYEVVSAADGEEALVTSKSEKPDLIISDVMMPKISGFEMLDIIRNTEGMKDVKIIMLTALGQKDEQDRADKLGADKYLVKSQVTLEDIVKAAHEMLGDQSDSASSTSPQTTPTAETPTAATVPTEATSVETSTSMDESAETEATPSEGENEALTSAVDSLLAKTPGSEKSTEKLESAALSGGSIVIEPIAREPEKDINQLLAEEEAKEKSAADSAISAIKSSPAAPASTESQPAPPASESSSMQPQLNQEATSISEAAPEAPAAAQEPESQPATPPASASTESQPAPPASESSSMQPQLNQEATSIPEAAPEAPAAAQEPAGDQQKPFDPNIAL